jgi:8-oxo-dGTP pyrophosphatase MutT (NUDIX family)
MSRPRKQTPKKKARRQVAALPFQAGDDGPRVMLVTSRETGRWVLPKGWPKKRLSGPEVAAMEAFEEAGLAGGVARKPIGAFRYVKRLSDGTAVPCYVDVYVMTVERQLDDWPERAQRRRQWFTPVEAAGMVQEEDLMALLLRLVPNPAPIAP